VVRVGDNWRCPYCGFPQVISQSRKHNPWEELKVKGGKIARLQGLVGKRSFVQTMNAAS